MTRQAFLLCMLMCLSLAPAWAVDIQRLLSNGNVAGVSDSQIPEVPGHGVVTVSGTASQIVWPVPAGCSVGHPEWSRITDPDQVTLDGGGLAVRPGLVFFSTSSPLLTGCHQVSSLAQLNTLYRQVMIDTVAQYGFLGALNEVAVVVLKRCPDPIPPATSTPNCTTARANMDILDNDYPGAGGVAQATTDLVTLRTDKCAFQAAQGWGACP
jgi:hypothetical protein